ncbi:MAG: DUF2911 domain-containing protein [Bryobacteraceae bacterium]
MRRRTWLTLSLSLGLLAASAAYGQRVAKINADRPSPDDVVTAVIGGKKVTVEYSRPSVKGRKIFGGLVPFGQVWRTGANEATVLTVEGDFMVGTVHVPAGSYSLFTVPGEKEWTLILNKTVKQWGAFRYDKNMDLGRAGMKVGTPASAVEKFTITIEQGAGNQGVLKLAWDQTEATVDLMAH